jgi:hypothetical protein
LRLVTETQGMVGRRSSRRNLVQAAMLSTSIGKTISSRTGPVGLACYSWFVIAVGRTAWKLRNRVPAGFAHAYVYGALAGLIGLLVSGALGDWVVPFVYNIGFAGFRAGILGWLFLGGLLAIENMSRREQPALSDA